MAQSGKGPAQHVGGTIGGIYLFDGLGDVVVTLERTVMRVDAGPFSGMTQRQQQHRRGIGVGGSDAGVGVLGPGSVLHGEYADVIAVADAAKAIGDADPDPFLAADDGPDAPQRGCFDHRCCGEARKVLDTLPFENLGYGFNGIQWGRLLISVLAGIPA